MKLSIKSSKKADRLALLSPEPYMVREPGMPVAETGLFQGAIGGSDSFWFGLFAAHLRRRAATEGVAHEIREVGNVDRAAAVKIEYIFRCHRLRPFEVVENKKGQIADVHLVRCVYIAKGPCPELHGI